MPQFAFLACNLPVWLAICLSGLQPAYLACSLLPIANVEFAYCRDQDDLVTLEAVKALFGQLPPYNPSVMTGATAQTPQEELVSNRMRIRAWSMVASQVLV